MIQIKLRDITGNIIEQEVGSENLTPTLDRYRQQGYTILLVKNQNKAVSLNRSKLDIYIFAKEFLILLEAGLNINEAFQTFILKESNSYLKMIYSEILHSLNQGKRLSQAFSNHNECFPKIFISAIQSSETSGNIQQSLKRFIAYQYQERVLRSQIKSASIYPILLSITGMIVTLFLLGYVVPKFSIIYESSGRDIPFLSKILLKFSNWIAHNQTFIVFLTILTIIVCIKLISNKYFQSVLVTYVIRYKYFKQIFEEYYLSKFYRVMGLLIESGMPLIDSIDLAKTLLHSYYDDKIMSAKQQISSGGKLSEALWNHGLALPVAYSMLKVSEGTGDFSRMFDSSADFYEEKLTYHIQILMKVFEPILMILIGLIIGIVVVLLYLPIFDLAGTVGS